jgi:hypothetical protein
MQYIGCITVKQTCLTDAAVHSEHVQVPRCGIKRRSVKRSINL